MQHISSNEVRAQERPNVSGLLQVPSHPPARRAGYVVVALLMALTATFGNALVNVNVANLSGAGGMYLEQASWLPAIYVAISACANLLLVKARNQFGLNTVCYVLLSAYIVAALLQFAFPDFASAILIRAISGMLGAGLTTVTVYNLLQVFPEKLRPAALLIGVTLPQFSTPLARMVPIEMLAVSGWQGLHVIELGLGLSALAAAVFLPLPPGDRADVFEPVDFVTIGLMLPAMVLLCGAVNEGRLLWWFDTPWLGWALAGAIVLAACAILVEAGRSKPLLQLRWLSSLDMLRFAAIAMLIRLALAEQTYGAVGLLTSSGLTNDQFHILFGLVVLAMLCGMITAVATARVHTLPYQVFAAALVIALGAWLDTGANNLTRPVQLYWSQSLIAFGTTLFFGPTMLYGALKTMERGPDYLISLVVVFSITQNVGGLLGSAALGTYQTAAARAHMQTIAERVVGADPMVAQRVADGAASLSGVLVDPAARAAQGGGQLAQAMGREASVLAFNDGRLSNATAAERAAFLGSKAGQANVRLGVTAAVVSTYFALTASTARLAVLRDTLAARSDSLRLTRRRAQAGYAPTLDLRQAEAEYEGAAQLIPATEQLVARQQNALSLLLGENPQPIFPDIPLSQVAVPEVPVGIPSTLLRRRPDVAQAEQQIVAADRSLDSARAAFMPNVQLNGSVGQVAAQLLSNPMQVFFVGGSVLAPIFDAGRLQAQEDRAVARRDEAAFAYRKAALTAFRDVEDALESRRRSAEQEATPSAQREALAQALAIAQQRYRAGYSPFLEQLEAQRSLLAADLALVQVRADRLSASVNLFQALGGGWEAPKNEQPSAMSR